MKAQFVYARSPKWDDPGFINLHSHQLPENWKSALQDEARVLEEWLSDMSSEEAIDYLEQQGRKFRTIDHETVEITLG